MKEKLKKLLTVDLRRYFDKVTAAPAPPTPVEKSRGWFFIFFPEAFECAARVSSEVSEVSSAPLTSNPSPLTVNPSPLTSNPSPLTPSDALAQSLNLYGRVDLAYMSRLAQLTEDELIQQLTGQIYLNPITDEWEHKSRFLSGNIVKKIQDITALSGTADEKKNSDVSLPALSGTADENALSALQSALPTPIPYEDLDINLGERWIPVSVYADFASHLFSCEMKIEYADVNDTYAIRACGYSPAIYRVYAVGKLNGTDLFVHALHDTTPDITKEVYLNGEKVRVPDEEAIQAAQMKIQEIRDKFNQWLDNQPLDYRDNIVREYNEKFNCYVRPSYDGSMQTFPDLCFDNFPFSDLYPSQKDAIWMIKQNGGGVCWHEVGAGKTLVMCVAAYEMKRLGLVRKPLIIGLKANVHEIADTYRKAYPNARLLYPGKDDFTVANRKELFRRIQQEEWDCVILTHEQFAKIPQSDEVQYRIFLEEHNDVVRCLDHLLDSNMQYASKKLLSGLEKRLQNLAAKLSELKEKINARKDDDADFLTMGFDHIFVDECHQFKNLMFQTRHTRVAGIGNNIGSQRAMNLLFAIRTIQERTGCDLGATFLSGTVVTNALTELYVIFKYLRPKELIRQNVRCFDAWAAVFTKKTSDYELSVTGQIRRNERFRTYIKVPELAAFLREITDYRTADMINLDIPAKTVRFLTEPPTAEQQDMIDRLVSFAKNGKWEVLGIPTLPPANLDKAKMLVATNIAQKMALDMRLLSEQYEDDQNSKASRCAREVYEYYRRYDHKKGTQFIFSDLGTYKPGNEWNIYNDIRAKLIELGIPAEEIAFIQKAQTEKARKRLFDDMNAGRVRVLFGSTTMLGTGVNAQQRAVAVHHLQIPWRPSDLEQRNGRAVRKGNEVKYWGGNNVDIIIYGTEQTLDAYKFNLLKNKQMFINQINNGNITSRRIDEDQLDENSGMNFAEFVAVLSGNQDLLNKAKLDGKILQLEKQQSIHNKERAKAERQLKENNEKIESNRRSIAKMKADHELLSQSSLSINLSTINPQLSTVHIATADETTLENLGRTLRTIADDHRGDRLDIGTLILSGTAVKGSADVSVLSGTATELKLWVRSEHTSVGFSHNAFFLEGQTGINYRYGATGSLPLKFTAAATYPLSFLDNIPKMIEKLQKTNDTIQAENPTLLKAMQEKWKGEPELNALRQQRDELQRRIDATLTAAA